MKTTTTMLACFLHSNHRIFKFTLHKCNTSLELRSFERHCKSFVPGQGEELFAIEFDCLVPKKLIRRKKEEEILSAWLIRKKREQKGYRNVGQYRKKQANIKAG